MAQSITRKQVVQATAALQRPEEVSRTRWRGVHAYLMAIASHYPKAFPSQERLAEEVQCSLRSIRGYQVLCQNLGLLHVTADAGAKGKHNTWSKTHQYHILIPDKSAGLIPANIAAKEPSVHYVNLRLVTSFPHSPSEGTRSGSASGLTGSRVNVGRVPSKVPPPRRPSPADLIVDSGKKIPPRPRKLTRQQAAVEYFYATWQALVEQPGREHLRNLRVLDNLGACRGYVTAHFLGAQPKSDDEIRQLIDAYVDMVSHGEIWIKPDQSVWQSFTGSWGKTRVAIVQRNEDALYDEYFGGTA